MSTVLGALLKRVPNRLLPYAKRWFVERAVPFNRRLGLRVVEVADDSSLVVLRLPPRAGNLNVSGTVHGAAILALGESVHGVAVLWQFPPHEHRMVTREVTVRYRAPARGELRVAFRLTPEVRATLEAALAAEGRAELEAVAQVTDAAGQVVAEVEATYQVRRTARTPAVAST